MKKQYILIFIFSIFCFTVNAQKAKKINKAKPVKPVKSSDTSENDRTFQLQAAEKTILPIKANEFTALETRIAENEKSLKNMKSLVEKNKQKAIKMGEKEIARDKKNLEKLKNKG